MTIHDRQPKALIVSDKNKALCLLQEAFFLNGQRDFSLASSSTRVLSNEVTVTCYIFENVRPDNFNPGSASHCCGPADLDQDLKISDALSESTQAADGSKGRADTQQRQWSRNMDIIFDFSMGAAKPGKELPEKYSP